jgi:hypothetical protein
MGDGRGCDNVVGLRAVASTVGAIAGQSTGTFGA